MTRAPILPGLTGARGVAAWFVVLYHLRTGYGDRVPEWLLAVLNKGYLAVDFFFMLSGFVLWRNYAVRMREAGLAGTPDFVWRRLARIWPLHALLLGLAAPFVLLLQSGGHDVGHYPWRDWPFHLAMVQAWGFVPTLRWNDPAWSISCEWAAYLLFPLLALAVDWRRWPTAGLLAMIGAFAVLLALIFAVQGFTTLGGIIAPLALPRALIGFTIGTIVSTLHDRGVGSGTGWLVTAALCGIAQVLGLPETLGLPLFLVALLMLLARHAGARANPLAHPAIVYLGEISYATYLFHFLGFIWFKLLFVDDAAAIPFASVAAFLAITLVASILLYHLVERPAQRWLHRAAPRFRRRPRPLPASGSAHR